MKRNGRIPKIPLLVVQKSYGPLQTPIDFKRFLYRGGAAAIRAKVNEQIDSGELGPVLIERLSLIRACFEHFQDLQNEGMPDSTFRTQFRCFLSLIKFVDLKGVSLTEESVLTIFKEWAQELHRRVLRRDLKEESMYSQVIPVTTLLSKVLGIPSQRIQKAARIKYTSNRYALVAEKQNLADTHGFVQDLLDVISCLSQDSIQGQLPAVITLRSTGKSYPQWGGLWREKKVPTIQRPELSTGWQVKKVRERRAPTNKKVAFERRYALLNLRATAEFMLFLSATGMNISQAAALTTGDYRLQREEKDITVRKYKNRKKGIVEFSIYENYRPYFHEYLAWRKMAYPKNFSNRLFFIVPNRGKINLGIRLSSLQDFFKVTGRTWLNAQTVRNTKGNWIARMTGRDDHAAMALQHDVNTFRSRYKRPNYQVAMREWSNYLNVIDPETHQPIAATGPGGCLATQEPEKISFALSESPDPDCGNPAGCWFCTHFRMIGSYDSIWGALSQRALERLKLASHLRLYSDEISPARLTIERINDAVEAFCAQGPIYQEWFDTANTRVLDEEYHPRWDIVIKLAEIGDA